MMASSAGGLHPGQPEPAAELGPVSFYPKPGQANGHARSVGDGRPPLPPGARARPARSREPSETADSGGGSDSDAQADSDRSDACGRKRPLEQADGASSGRKRRRSPALASADASAAPSAAATPDGSGSETDSLEGEEEDPSAAPARVVPADEEAEQKAGLRTSWELVAVLDFLAAFRPHLGLAHLRFSAEELESALVLSNGTDGLLPDLHVALLKGISARSTVHAGNWTGPFAEKLRACWRVGRLPGTPPFAPRRRYEAAAYATLPVADRVSALRLLCELRLEREDLHNVVEHALHPPRLSKAAKKAAAKAGGAPPEEPPLPTMEQMRRPPLGRDASGLLYWYLDHHETTGTRMYRETPESLLRGKAARKAAGPQWELVAASAEELEDLGKRLRRSKKAVDQALGDVLLDRLVPELLERREVDLRRQRQAARVQEQLHAILPGGEGGYGGRSRRARKEVNYSFDAYDAQIRQALRATGRGAEEAEARAARAAAFQESRLTAEEEAQLGLRRGRSAHAGEPAVELPPVTRRPRGAAAAAERTPTPPPDAGVREPHGNSTERQAATGPPAPDGCAPESAGPPVWRPDSRQAWAAGVVPQQVQQQQQYFNSAYSYQSGANNANWH